MLIPEYWAEARSETIRDGKPLTVRRFGWSETNQAEAEANAEERARVALARILAGEFLPRRELKRAYNGSVGVPIREEVVERRRDLVITRNSYGALCLNTPDCLFADIDFQAGPHARLVIGTFVAMLCLSAGVLGLGYMGLAAVLSLDACRFALNRWPGARRRSNCRCRFEGKINERRLAAPFV